MPDDDQSNVSPLRQHDDRAKAVRAGQTPLQQALAAILVGLLALAAVGALVRLNIWLWLGR